ncbi:peptidase M20 family protein [Sinorhizobium fredii]|uniref:Peptidase M20 family protein n=1 Tax=Rhizobium fredii TaxID=380 RepID=A0A2L0H7P5_RHIFR|nr:peptidase M20 family protein [Sinorhizobium fredii]
MDLGRLVSEMREWRRHLHAHPEFGFEERQTSAFVAAKLREFGLDDVAEGVGGTGVVGTLKRGNGNRSIALRADMDALRISEQSNLPHASRHPGFMHACGHDGHTAMLLGAARRCPRGVSSALWVWLRELDYMLGLWTPCPR